MRIRSSEDFLRAKFVRRRWIVGAGGITLLLCLLLVPHWLEIDWLIYPLPRIAAEIMQNLFWAFTTSTIFMAFENSVNGGGSLLERYRDINNSVAPLPNTMFSHQFLKENDLPDDPALRSQFNQDLRLFGSLGVEGIRDLVSRWDRFISLEAIDSTLQEYRDYLDRWRLQLANNDLFFAPAGIPAEFYSALDKECERLAKLVGAYNRCGTWNGPYWILEEDYGRSTIIVLEEELNEERFAELSESLQAPFGDAVTPLLSVMPLRVTGQPDTMVSVHVQAPVGHDFLYAPVGGPDDWAKPSGSRSLDEGFGADPLQQPAFWLTPPKHVLTADELVGMMEAMVTLSQKVDGYNEALKADLLQARRYATGQNDAS